MNDAGTGTGTGPAPDPQDGDPRETSPANLWVEVARHEVAVKLHDRTFLVGSAVMLVIMVATIGFQVWNARSAAHTSYRLAVTADAVDLGEDVAAAARADDSVGVQVVDVADAADARGRLADGDVDAWLHAGGQGWVLTGRDTPDEALSDLVAATARDTALAAHAEESGTTAEALLAGSDVQVRSTDAPESGGLTSVVGYAFALVFYIGTLTLGSTLASGVVEEKQSRIVEIVATAVPVRQLLAGKIVANCALALVQLAVYLVVGLVGLSFTPYSGLLTGVSVPAVWFVGFFLVGFVALASLWAAAGALVDKVQDLSSATTPLTVLMVVVLFGVLGAEGTWRTVVSFVPPFSAVLMPMRLLDGGATWWQAAVALALLAASAVGTVLVGERIYRTSLLRTGGRRGWREAWSDRG